MLKKGYASYLLLVYLLLSKKIKNKLRRTFSKFADSTIFVKTDINHFIQNWYTQYLAKITCIYDVTICLVITLQG